MRSLNSDVIIMIYSFIYDSMLVWYSRWYSKKFHLHGAVVMALTVSMFFNVSTVLVVVSIVGPVNLLKVPGASKMVYPMVGALLLVNVFFSWRKARSVSGRFDHSLLTATSSRPALLYMIGSCLALIGSFALLVVIKG